MTAERKLERITVFHRITHSFIKKIPLINFVSFIFCVSPFILLLFSINNWINCWMVVENDTTLTIFSFLFIWMRMEFCLRTCHLSTIHWFFFHLKSATRLTHDFFSPNSIRFSSVCDEFYDSSENQQN